LRQLSDRYRNIPGDVQVYKAVRTARLYEQIVKQIEESVKEGKLKPGDQLPAERELALQFGVSRTAIREAVKTLSEKGLVEAYSGRGTFITSGRPQAMSRSMDWLVKSSHSEDSTYLVEVREILEPEISAMAAIKIDEEHLTTMRETVAVMDRSLRDPEAYIEADLDFHLSLAEAAANPIILSLLDSIVGALREQRLGIFNVGGGPERGQIHHKRILGAIEHRDAAQAREAMHAHMRQIREDSSASTTHRGKTSEDLALKSERS
jgi:GntR family transcriptional repressor for pyruvate dehydrogenase complex